MLKTIFLICLAAVIACAQDSVPVTGPIAGFVFDAEAGALVPILGVPGAAYLGPAMVAGLERASVSPDGTAALAVSEGRLQLIAGLRRGRPVITEIAGAIGGVDLIAWSSAGDLAAVYASASGQAQILRDLTRTPAAGDVIAVRGGLTVLGVSAAGELVGATEDGVYLLAPGSARMLATTAKAAAMAFHGRDVFIAETGGNRILLIEDFAVSAAVSTFAEGVEMPVGVQVSADGKRLYVAGSKAGILRAYDVAGRYATGKMDLDCRPSELRPAGGRDLWLLNSDGKGSEPLYIATGDGDPAAWFVPAGREQ